MLETTCPIFDPAIECDAWCVTTNQTLDSRGHLVMGAGVALEAKRLFPHLPERWGAYVAHSGHGRVEATLCDAEYVVVSFPVKGSWRADALLPLITRSARELVTLTNRMGWTRVMLPRPGCGRGGLDWDDVRETIAPILDDRFTVFCLDPK
jgi:O-acetyl-ADP-ribose deacetylase (regulator of RNase III)